MARKKQDGKDRVPIEKGGRVRKQGEHPFDTKILKASRSVGNDRYQRSHSAYRDTTGNPLYISMLLAST